MTVRLQDNERLAFQCAIAASERIYNYCRVMIDNESPIKNIEAIADVHAATACLMCELQELIDTIDGALPSSDLVSADLRVILLANEIAQRMKGRAAEDVVKATEALYAEATAF